MTRISRNCSKLIVFFIKKLISLIVRRRTKRGSTVGMIQYFFSIKKLNRYSNQVSESNYKFSLQNVRIINAVLLHSLVMISLYSTHFIFCKRKLGKTKTKTFPSNFPRKNACFPMFQPPFPLRFSLILSQVHNLVAIFTGCFSNL